MSPSSPNFTAGTLFANFYPTIDRWMETALPPLPANACDPSNPNYDLGFDPMQPNRVIPGCVTESYDTRALYDASRRQFWIESAMRNYLWQCPPGAETTPSMDPDPNHPPNAICHTAWNPGWAHRFISIAITRVNAQGQEDLSQPFYQYAATVPMEILVTTKACSKGQTYPTAQPITTRSIWASALEGRLQARHQRAAD